MHTGHDSLLSFAGKRGFTPYGLHRIDVQTIV
jgi:hypothetical protein